MIVVRSLWIGAAGLSSGQLQMDVVANNIANINTTAFQSRRPAFRDQMNMPLSRPIIPSTEELPTTSAGAGAAAIERDTGQGPLITTNNQYHLAIQGPGYFRVRAGDGSLRYTRAGAFSRDGSGRLVTASGAVLLLSNGSPLVLPEGTRNLTVTPDGLVLVETSSGTRELGQISIAIFNNPNGLESLGDDLYAVTLSSGPARDVRPGSEGAGELRQGMMEQSNVDLGREMVNMLLANRYTQFSARIVHTADEMMALANRLPT